MDNQNDQTLKLLKDVPDLRQRVLNVLKIYEYDVSTKRKENAKFSYAFWKIKTFIDGFFYHQHHFQISTRQRFWCS